MLTQMGMKKIIKIWGEKGMTAITKEMKQLHDKNVVNSLKVEDITPEVKTKSLGYLMFLEQKRNENIKGKGCADGRPQRLHKQKSETSFPTATIESIFITGLIDTQENRDMVIVDIPGAFLQTAASDNTIIKLQGAIVKITLKINPSWRKFVVLVGKKQVPTIYSEAIKALYGTVNAAKLFYNNLCHVLIDELGFTINPYDGCVANKLIKNTQCTIVFFVDDLKNGIE